MTTTNITSETINIVDIPIDILREIFSYVDAGNLVVSKYIHSVATDKFCTMKRILKYEYEISCMSESNIDNMYKEVVQTDSFTKALILITRNSKIDRVRTAATILFRKAIEYGNVSFIVKMLCLDRVPVKRSTKNIAVIFSSIKYNTDTWSIKYVKPYYGVKKHIYPLAEIIKRIDSFKNANIIKERKTILFGLSDKLHCFDGANDSTNRRVRQEVIMASQAMYNGINIDYFTDRNVSLLIPLLNYMSMRNGGYKIRHTAGDSITCLINIVTKLNFNVEDTIKILSKLEVRIDIFRPRNKIILPPNPAITFIVSVYFAIQPAVLINFIRNYDDFNAYRFLCFNTIKKCPINYINSVKTLVEDIIECSPTLDLLVEESSLTRKLIAICRNIARDFDINGI